MIQRFSIPDPDDSGPRDLLDRCDEFELKMFKLRGRVAFNFKISGSSGSFFSDDDADDDGSATAEDLAFLGKLLAHFQKRPQLE